MKTLVVGYGNESRSEDGVGILVANRIGESALQDVEVVTCQQLHVDRIEDFINYDRVVLVDAAVTGPDVELRAVKPESQDVIESSHHLGPEYISALAKKIYGIELSLYVCSIRAQNFEFGYDLSDEVKKAANKAEKMIRKFIEKGVT